jgi:Na+-driven multidrug efflux pump
MAKLVPRSDFSGPLLPLSTAMSGAGDTRPPMIVAFIANWAVKLPPAHVLALPLGHGVDSASCRSSSSRC